MDSFLVDASCPVRTPKAWLKRLTAGLGLFAMLAASLAIAATTSSSLYFSTSGQNIWGGGATTPLPGDKCLCLTWGNPYPSDYYKYYDLDPAGDVWGATSGKVGLDFNLSGSAGSMALNYPMQVNLSFPDPGALLAGSTFTIGSSYNALPSGYNVTTHFHDASGTLHSMTFNTGGPVLQTQGPSIYASLDAVANIKAQIGGHLFGIDLPTVGPNMNETYNFFRVNPAQGANIDLIPNILSGYAQAPNLNTESSGVSGNNLESSMRDNLGGVKLNIANLITEALGGPPLSGHIGPVDYNLIKVGLGLNLDLQQSFSFVPQPLVHLDFTSPVDVYSGGVWNQKVTSVNFLAGDSVSLRAPNALDLGVTPSILLNNTTTNTTDAILAGQLDMSALGLGISDLDWSVGPLIHPKPLQFDLDSFNFYNNSFNLDTGPALKSSPFNLHFKDLFSSMASATTGMCALAPDLPQCAGVEVSSPDATISTCAANPTLPECQGVDWANLKLEPCVLDTMSPECTSFNYRLRMPDPTPSDCIDVINPLLCSLENFPLLVEVNGECTESDPLLCALHDLIGALDGAWNDTHSAWVFANNGFAALDGISLADPSTDEKALQRLASLGYNPADYLITPFNYSVPEPGTALLVLGGLLGLGFARRARSSVAATSAVMGGN